MPHFNRDGIQFYYREAGEGVPLIYQHGLGGEAALIFALLKPAPGVRLLSMDFRGHGQTTPLGNPAQLNFNAFADDLAAFLDHLRLEQAIMGGTSMGAGAALNFTLRYPARARGLILVRPAWLDRPRQENVNFFGAAARMIRQHGATRGLELFQQTEIYEEIRRESPDAAASLLAQFLHPRAEETVEKLERIPADAPNRDRNQWSRIRTPALVVANRNDPIHPFEYGVELARSIPGAEFVEVTSKSISLTQYNLELQRALDGFLKRHWLAKAGE